MPHFHPFIPSLPDAWPFQPRTGLPPLTLREDVDIPGLGAGWTILATEDLPRSGSLEPIGGSFGRGGVARLGDLVVRPYRRGGLLRHLNERTYPSQRRFQNELGLHRALWEAGLPTVPPVGCAWRERGWGVEGAFLTAWVDGLPWPRQWGGATWEVVAGFMTALAHWGCWIPDFNATNVHLGADGTVRILDFDRGSFGASGDLEARYRGRMLRSLAKLGAPESLRAQAEGRDR